MIDAHELSHDGVITDTPWRRMEEARVHHSVEGNTTWNAEELRPLKQDVSSAGFALSAALHSDHCSRDKTGPHCSFLTLMRVKLGNFQG